MTRCPQWWEELAASSGRWGRAINLLARQTARYQITRIRQQLLWYNTSNTHLEILSTSMTLYVKENIHGLIPLFFPEHRDSKPALARGRFPSYCDISSAPATKLPLIGDSIWNQDSLGSATGWATHRTLTRMMTSYQGSPKVILLAVNRCVTGHCMFIAYDGLVIYALCLPTGHVSAVSRSRDLEQRKAEDMQLHL